MTQKEEDKEQLILDLLDSQDKYAIATIDFRVKSVKEEGEVRFFIMELFPDTIYTVFGFADDEDLFNTIEEHYRDVSEFISEEGYYNCDVLLVKDTDSDGYSNWEWWEMEHMTINYCNSIEEIEESESVEVEPDNTTDDLPF
jgi:hypothetical protein